MGWSRKAKVSYYWIRRRQAVKEYTEAAVLLGTSVKAAKKRAIKQFGKEYRMRREDLRKANVLQHKIEKLQKGSPTVKRAKKMARFEKQKKKIIAQTTQRWDSYMFKIKFKPVGDEDERSKRDTP